MFNLFRNKDLELRVQHLEKEIHKALHENKELAKVAAEVVTLQEKVQQGLESQLKTAQQTIKKLSAKNRKLEKADKYQERGVVGSGKLSNKNFTPSPVYDLSPKTSRMESIKKAVDKLTPPKKVVIGEITPRSVNLGKMPPVDRAAVMSDLLELNIIPTGGNNVSIDGTDIPMKVIAYREGVRTYNCRIKEDCYLVVADKVTNKFYLHFAKRKDASESGSYSFSQGSARLATIRANHVKVLQVLKDKVGG